MNENSLTDNLSEIIAHNIEIEEDGYFNSEELWEPHSGEYEIKNVNVVAKKIIAYIKEHKEEIIKIIE